MIPQNTIFIALSIKNKILLFEVEVDILDLDISKCGQIYKIFAWLNTPLVIWFNQPFKYITGSKMVGLILAGLEM